MTSPNPKVLHLMLTSRCDARCVHCYEQPLIKAKVVKPGGLRLQDIRELIARYALSLQTVGISGYGEPTLHPKFAEILETIGWCQQKYGWANVNMGTNGAHLTQEQAKLICAMPGQISVSFDAVDPDIFRSIRAGLAPLEVIKGIDLLLAAPRHARRQIGINMVVLHQNVSEILRVAAFAHHSGLNYVSFSRGIRLGDRVEGVAANDQAALAAIQAARARFPDVQINAHFFEGSTTSRWHPTRCAMPENELLVMHDGHVYPCCFATDTDLGHWRKVDWHGPEFTELRQALATAPVDGQRYPTCAACPLVPPW